MEKDKQQIEYESQDFYTSEYILANLEKIIEKKVVEDLTKKEKLLDNISQ